MKRETSKGKRQYSVKGEKSLGSCCPAGCFPFFFLSESWGCIWQTTQRHDRGENFQEAACVQQPDLR